MSAERRSRAEVVEAIRAGANPPLCPICGAGNLGGEWEGPLGQYDQTDVRAGRLVLVQRGEWRWICDCGESGPWIPSLDRKADPFISGLALEGERE